MACSVGKEGGTGLVTACKQVCKNGKTIGKGQEMKVKKRKIYNVTVVLSKLMVMPQYSRCLTGRFYGPGF